jgi:hypothetical protein
MGFFIGTVTAADAETRRARCKIEDVLGDRATPWLKIVDTFGSMSITPAGDPSHTHGAVYTPWTPQIGETVVCGFLDGGGWEGYIFGRA